MLLLVIQIAFKSVKSTKLPRVSGLILNLGYERNRVKKFQC